MQVILDTVADLEQEIGVVEDNVLFKSLTKKLGITRKEAQILINQLIEPE